MSKKTVQSTTSKSGDKLPELFLNTKPNIHLLHLAALRQLNNRRRGTASTKTRSEVRGGGKKPWKQKGTGRARAGSIRSPLWVGGGIAFGPKPRDFKFELPKKERNLAILHAISLRKDEIVTIDGLPENKGCKTKVFNGYVNSLSLGNDSLLFICSSSEPHFKEARKAAGNLPYIEVLDEKYVGVHDILRARTVIVTEKALSTMESRFLKKKGKE
jgi:large subunit ribosomal protein L4